MALHDILQSIDSSADERIAAIEQEGARRLEERGAEWNKRLGVRRKEIIDRATRRVALQVHAAELVLKTQSAERLLRHKQDLLDTVYGRSVALLAHLSDARYVELMTRLITNLPERKGVLISAAGKKDLLKKALKASGRTLQISAEHFEARGGFVFQADRLAVDNTFEALVEHVKDDTRVEIGALIFRW